MTFEEYCFVVWGSLVAILDLFPAYLVYLTEGDG